MLEPTTGSTAFERRQSQYHRKTVIGLLSILVAISCRDAQLEKTSKQATDIGVQGGGAGSRPEGDGGGFQGNGGGSATSTTSCANTAGGGTSSPTREVTLCYVLESAASPHLVLNAIHLDGGLVHRVWQWTVPTTSGNDYLLAEGLTYDGAQFVAVVGGETSNLIVLDPHTTQAQPGCSYPSSTLAWSGVDWFAEYGIDNVFGRFRDLQAVCDGLPSVPVLDSSDRALTVAGGRIFGSSTANTVSIYDLCSGDKIGNLTLQGSVSPDQLLVVREWLYVLDTSDDTSSSILTFSLDGGSLLGRVQFKGARPVGLVCTPDPVPFGGDGGS